MFGRTVIAATALAATALTAPAPLAGTHAGARSTESLSNADNGRTISIDLGDTVKVNLKAVTGRGVKWVWDVPAASDTGVLQRLSGRTVPSGNAEATFRGVEGGQSAITAHRRCVVTTPGHACPQVVLLWKVTIDVR